MIEPGAAQLLMDAHNAGLISRETWGSIGKHIAQSTPDWGAHYHKACKQLGAAMLRVRRDYAGVDFERFALLVERKAPLAVQLWQRLNAQLLERRDIVWLCRQDDTERAAQILLARAELRRPENGESWVGNRRAGGP